MSTYTELCINTLKRILNIKYMSEKYLNAKNILKKYLSIKYSEKHLNTFQTILERISK